MTLTSTMPALMVTPRRPHSIRLGELPCPAPAPGEALVRVVQAGICGTDMEIMDGLFGSAPAGEDWLTLGHESFGVVEQVGAEVTGLRPGQYVVGVVRHPDGCENCRRREQDMCVTGGFTERGVIGLHGFMRPYYTDVPEFLVPAPAGLRPVGVLVETLSVVEKAAVEIPIIQRRLHWEPRTAVVLGAGAVGLMATALFRHQGLEVVTVALPPASDRRAGVATALGASYVSARDVPVARLAEHLGRPVDIVFEATGSSAVAMDAFGIVGVNGVLCLTSITGGGEMMNVPAAAINQRMVLGNRAVFGTVTSNRSHYEMAIRDLAQFQARWPGVIEGMITHHYPLAAYGAALEMVAGRDGIKVTLDVTEG